MIEFLLFIIGLLIGGAVVFIFVHQPKTQQLENELKQTEAKLNQEAFTKVKALSELDALRQMQAEAERKLNATLESFASKAMQSNTDVFLQLAGQTFEKYIQKAGSDYAARSESFNQLVLPLKDILSKHELLVNDVRRDTGQSFGSVLNFLQDLNQNQEKLKKETNSLVTALKAPKVRGRWGEIGLRRIVEFSGLNKYCDFTEQTSAAGADGLLRPDMIVHLPGGKNIIIDSKVPLQAYLDAVEAEDELEAKQLLDKHCHAVFGHVKALSDKKYWAQFEGSVDFVVLYMEVEPAFSAAMANDKDLIKNALDRKIIFATPSTLLALLLTVEYSWKQYAAVENAEAILQASKELYERLGTLFNSFQTVGDNVQKLVKSYNSTVASYQTRVLPQLKRIENMGISGSKKNFDDIADVNDDIRN